MLHKINLDLGFSQPFFYGVIILKLAIIITGGNAPLFIPDTIPLDNTFIVAADSGLDVAEILGLKCDVVITIWFENYLFFFQEGADFVRRPVS